MRIKQSKVEILKDIQGLCKSIAEVNMLVGETEERELKLKGIHNEIQRLSVLFNE